MDDTHGQQSTYWLAIPQQEGWGLFTAANSRKIGVLFSIGMKGKTILKIAGYHLGDTKWIGEQKDILAVKIERIPEGMRDKITPQIRKSLVRELQDVEILFLDDKYHN